MTRLDYFIVPVTTCMLCAECNILPAVISDHCPVVLRLDMYNTMCGAGYWKLNVNHLNNRELVDSINEVIEVTESR